MSSSGHGRIIIDKMRQAAAHARATGKVPDPEIYAAILETLASEIEWLDSVAGAVTPGKSAEQNKSEIRRMTLRFPSGDTCGND